MSWVVTGVVSCIAVWYFLTCQGLKYLLETERTLRQLERGENYYRMVEFDHNERTYLARVRRWNISDRAGMAELWCVEGSNPDGWTEFFFWDKDELRFV